MGRSARLSAFTQGFTICTTIGWRSGFHQLESSLASHSITLQIKKRKKTLQKTYFLGIFSPGGTTICPQVCWALRELQISQRIFWTIFRKDFIAIRLDGYYINLVKCLFSKDSLQYFFSKEGNKPNRSKLEEIEKMHAPKKHKIQDVLEGFQIYTKYTKLYSTI